MGTVYDSYTKSASSPVKMTRKSTWLEAVEAAGVLAPFPFYVLDPAIYDERAALLLPRAVAYSAGLLDYFFNGRLRISLPDEGAYALADQATSAGFTVVRLKLTNATPPLQDDGVSVPQNLYNGTAVAIVKYHRNTCYRADLNGEYGSPSKSPFHLPREQPPDLRFTRHRRYRRSHRGIEADYLVLGCRERRRHLPSISRARRFRSVQRMSTCRWLTAAR